MCDIDYMVFDEILEIQYLASKFDTLKSGP